MNWTLLKVKGIKKYAVVTILSVGLLIGGILSMVLTGKAQEAAITVETSEGTAKRLDEFKVKITIHSPEPVSILQAYLSYDSNVIEFVSSETSTIVGDGGIVKIEDVYHEGITEATYELTFKALEVGKSNLELYDIKAEGAEQAQVVQLQPKSASVEVVINRSEPTDARLNSILVADGKLKPDFDLNVFEYSIKVPYEVETLMFSADPVNEESIVELDQAEKLEHGNNVILIHVTSPSGVMKTYTLNVYRAMTEDEILDEENSNDNVDAPSSELPDDKNSVQSPDQETQTPDETNNTD